METTSRNITATEDLVNFLRRIVPDGVLVAAHKNAQLERPKMKVFQDHQHLAEFLLQMAWQKNDVWFATAAFKQGWHPSPKDPSKHVLRTHENVLSLKSFYIDIDMGKVGTYQTLYEAVSHLKEFCRVWSLPEPTFVVQSGNGLHVYWTMDRPVSPAEWQEVADALKKAASEFGLKYDPVCTADRARILRPIHSFNMKYDPPSRVSLLSATAYDLTLEHMKTALRRVMNTLPVNTANPTQKDNSDLSSGIEQNSMPKFTGFIVERCEVLKEIKETRGANCEEPLWKSVLQLLVHTSDGDKWIHALSDGHPGYDFQKTEEKFAERKASNVGPTLCTTFNEFRPEKCRACIFNGKTKTPALLGADLPQWKSPQEIPHGFRYTDNGTAVERRVISESADAEGNPITVEQWVSAVPFGIHMPHLGHDDEGVHTLWFTSKTKGGEVEVSIPTADIGNMRDLLTTVHSKGLMVKQKYQKHLVELLMAWINQLRDAKQTIQTVSKFGWDDRTGQPAFTLADRTIFSDGKVNRGIHIDSQFGNIVKYYIPKGDLQHWQACATHIVTAGPNLAVILASAFAAPLLSMTELSGVMLSATSQKSGVGKSTAMRTAQAVWGSPDGGVNSLDDTEASITKKLGLLNHLPAYWDELRGDVALEGFGNTVFKLTGGKERSRLRADTSARDVGTWQTMLVAASNQSLREFISNHSGMTDAGNLRVLEYEIETLKSDLTQSEAGDLFRDLKVNYGVAGVEYAMYITSKHDEIKSDITNIRAKLEKTLNATHDERFWLATIAILLQGAQLASEIGLVKFDMKELLDFLINVFYENRKNIVTQNKVQGAPAILADYLNDQTKNRLVVDRRPINKHDKTVQIIAGDANLDIAYEIIVEDKHLNIPRSRFERWCRRNRIQAVTTEKALTKAYNVQKGYRYLGSGLSGTSSSRLWCLEVDMNHPDFKDIFDSLSK